MKILQLCNKPPYPPRDGGSMAMFTLAESLKNMGHQITVLTMVTGKHSLSEAHYKEFSDIMEIHTVLVDTSVKWHGVLKNFLFSRNPYTATRFQSSDVETELIRLLHSTNYDVVQLEGLYLTPYIPIIRKISDALVSFRAHNVEHEIWERVANQEKNSGKKIYFKLLSRRIRRFELSMLNMYDLLVPITHRDLHKFNSLGNIKPAHVCPAGVTFKKPGTVKEKEINGPEHLDQKPFSLFFLGSLDWIPNQEGLLWFINMVLPSLHQRYPGLQFHIGGRNASATLIKKFQHPGIVFHGEIEDSGEFMQAFTAMVAPCFSGGGMRLKIVEAMSLGKTVITTAIGAEGLSVTHRENILLADDKEDFGQNIEMLMNNPELCQTMGMRAYKLINEKYNNLTVAALLAEFYKYHLK